MMMVLGMAKLVMLMILVVVRMGCMLTMMMRRAFFIYSFLISGCLSYANDYTFRGNS